MVMIKHSLTGHIYRMKLISSRFSVYLISNEDVSSILKHRDLGQTTVRISSVMIVSWDFLHVPWKDSICNINTINYKQ